MRRYQPSSTLHPSVVSAWLWEPLALSRRGYCHILTGVQRRSCSQHSSLFRMCCVSPGTHSNSSSGFTTLHINLRNNSTSVEAETETHEVGVRIPHTRLHVVHPDLLDEWVAEQNDVDVSTLSSSSTKEIVWRCKVCHQVYKASVRRRIHVGPHCCPHCHGNGLSITFARSSAESNTAGAADSPAVPNSFADTHPNLLAYWDTERNGPLQPHQVPCNSTMSVWWRRPGEDPDNTVSFQLPVCAFVEDPHPLSEKLAGRAVVEQKLLQDIQGTTRRNPENTKMSSTNPDGEMKDSMQEAHEALLLRDWAVMTRELQQEMHSFRAALRHQRSVREYSSAPSPSGFTDLDGEGDEGETMPAWRNTRPARGRGRGNDYISPTMLSTVVGPRAKEHFLFARSHKTLSSTPPFPPSFGGAPPSITTTSVRVHPATVKQKLCHIELNLLYRQALKQYPHAPEDPLAAEECGFLPDPVLLHPDTWKSFFAPSEAQREGHRPVVVGRATPAADPPSDAVKSLSEENTILPSPPHTSEPLAAPLETATLSGVQPTTAVERRPEQHGAPSTDAADAPTPPRSTIPCLRFSDSAELHLAQETLPPPEVSHSSSVYIPFPMPPADTQEPAPKSFKSVVMASLGEDVVLNAAPPPETPRPQVDLEAPRSRAPLPESHPEDLPETSSGGVEPDPESLEAFPSDAPASSPVGDAPPSSAASPVGQGVVSLEMELAQEVQELERRAKSSDLEDFSAAYSFSMANNPSYARPVPPPRPGGFRLKLPRASSGRRYHKNTSDSLSEKNSATTTSPSSATRLQPPPSSAAPDHSSSAGPAVRAAAKGAVLEAPRSPRKVSRPRRAAAAASSANTESTPASAPSEV